MGRAPSPTRAPFPTQGVRGIATVGGELWVANRNLGGVEVLDLATGAADVVVYHCYELLVHYSVILF